jgi:hypothetical protein
MEYYKVGAAAGLGDDKSVIGFLSAKKKKN